MIYLFRYIIGALLIVFSQVLIFNRIELGLGTCIMISPLFIMVLPFRMNLVQTLLIVFLVGSIIDIFMSTYGLHASAMVFAAYIRPSLFKLIAPNEDYIRGNDVNNKYSSKMRFFILLLTLVLMHNLWFFILESFALDEFIFTSLRILLSTVASTTVVFIIFLLFLQKTNVE
jgi:hypothetical protein